MRNKIVSYKWIKFNHQVQALFHYYITWLNLLIIHGSDEFGGFPLLGPPGVRLPALVWDMKFCLTSLILCCNCFLLVNIVSCSAKNLFVAAADGKKVFSLANSSITSRLCLLSVRR